MVLTSSLRVVSVTLSIRYRDCVKILKDATGLSGGVSRSLLVKKSDDPSSDATGLPRGGSRWLLRANAVPTEQVTFKSWLLFISSSQRETPPRKAVASSKVCCCSSLAASVRLHRARRWHLQKLIAVHF